MLSGIKRLFRHLLPSILGGRPMTFVQYRFTDVVVHKPVNLYVDHKGRRWLAFSKWSIFRVRRE